MPSSSAPVDPVTAYARGAVKGDFVVGELVRHACDRHLRDLRDGEKRGLVWRPERAQRFLDFLPALFTITDGPAAGNPFTPLPWMVFVGGSLTGWYTTDDRWRFRLAWIETGKGQAKSPFMAGLGLYGMGWDDAPRAQVYSIGGDKSTANVLFQDAVAMCRAQVPGWDEGESLESVGEVLIRGELQNAWMIEHPGTGSFFKPLAYGEQQSGPRPKLVLGDEIHEFKTDSQIETWRRAIAKIAGSAMMVLGTNTPATAQLVGTKYSEMVQSVVRGDKKDDSLFGFIARVDKADRDTVFENEACWPKALPALGITYPVANIRAEVASAALLPSTASSVKRLYFGIPIGAADFWINEAVWAAALDTIDDEVIAALKGCRCWLSLDLSKKNDLTALTATWIDGAGVLWQKTWYWTTQDGLAERASADNAPYEEWVEAGWLTAVPGATIDKTFVAARVAELCAEHNVVELVFDPAQMADFLAACETIGFDVWKFEGPKEPEGTGLKLVSHAQGTRVVFEDRQHCMPRSIERYEDRILKGTIVIDNSPVTYSCAANAAILEDGMKNRAFDKKRSRGRIDGIVTGAMGAGAADGFDLDGKSYDGNFFVEIDDEDDEETVQ